MLYILSLLSSFPSSRLRGWRCWEPPVQLPRYLSSAVMRRPCGRWGNLWKVEGNFRHNFMPPFWDGTWQKWPAIDHSFSSQSLKGNKGKRWVGVWRVVALKTWMEIRDPFAVVPSSTITYHHRSIPCGMEPLLCFPRNFGRLELFLLEPEKWMLCLLVGNVISLNNYFDLSFRLKRSSLNLTEISLAYHQKVDLHSPHQPLLT